MAREDATSTYSTWFAPLSMGTTANAANRP